MLGVRLLQISALYLAVGLTMGLIFGITGNFLLASVHSHVLLLGWATLALAGIVYHLLPACANSKLAKVHAWGHNIGLPVMMVSLSLKELGHKQAEPVLAASSSVVLLSLLLFVVNVLRNGAARTE